MKQPISTKQKVGDLNLTDQGIQPAQIYDYIQVSGSMWQTLISIPAFKKFIALILK